MRSMLSLLAVAALAAAAAPTPAAAGDCIRISLAGQTALNPATGAIEGVFTGTADGQPTSVASATTILGQEERGAVLFLTTSHLLTLPDGTQLRTLDNARLVQTPIAGVYHTVSRLEIVDGGSGFLVGVGTLDFRGGISATWKEVHGQVCGE